MNNKEKIIKNHELRLLRKIHELDYYAGRENTGNYQPVIGFYAGYLNSGDRYTATGYYAGYLNTGSHQTTRSYQTTTGYYEGKPQRVLMRAIKTQGVTKSQPVFLKLTSVILFSMILSLMAFLLVLLISIM